MNTSKRLQDRLLNESYPKSENTPLGFTRVDVDKYHEDEYVTTKGNNIFIKLDRNEARMLGNMLTDIVNDIKPTDKNELYIARKLKESIRTNL